MQNDFIEAKEEEEEIEEIYEELKYRSQQYGGRVGYFICSEYKYPLNLEFTLSSIEHVFFILI